MKVKYFLLLLAALGTFGGTEGALLHGGETAEVAEGEGPIVPTESEIMTEVLDEQGSITSKAVKKNETVEPGYGDGQENDTDVTTEQEDDTGNRKGPSPRDKMKFGFHFLIGKPIPHSYVSRRGIPVYRDYGSLFDVIMEGPFPRHGPEYTIFVLDDAAKARRSARSGGAPPQPQSFPAKPANNKETTASTSDGYFASVRYLLIALAVVLLMVIMVLIHIFVRLCQVANLLSKEASLDQHPAHPHLGDSRSNGFHFLMSLLRGKFSSLWETQSVKQNDYQDPPLHLTKVKINTHDEKNSTRGDLRAPGGSYSATKSHNIEVLDHEA